MQTEGCTGVKSYKQVLPTKRKQCVF